MSGIFGYEGMPVGLGIALAQNNAALGRFTALPEQDRQKIIDGAKNISSN